MKKLFLLFVVGLLFTFSSARGFSDVTLADQGHSKAVIFVDHKALGSLQVAAKELQKHFQLVTGVELPIVDQPGSGDAYTIYLGDSQFARDKGIDTEKMPHDGFRVLSGDNWLVIAGRDYAGPPLSAPFNPWRTNESYSDNFKLGAFGDAGTLHGVYYFLDQYLGVRWYMPGDLGVVAPKQATLSIPAIDVQKAPTFEHRFPYFCFFPKSDEDTLWYFRAGFGTPFPVGVSHSFGPYFIKYKDTHPEYFAIIDGKKDFTNLSSNGPGNLNLSNPGLLQQVIDDANDYFDKNPDQKIFSLCPNDGTFKISEDPESQAQLIPNRDSGTQSNYVWGFIDKVARGVAAKHPNKYIGCIAYEEYRLPPTNIDKLSPNVLVVLCKTRGSYTSPTYKAMMDSALKDWKEKATTLYCWEYYCDIIINPGWRGYPIFYPELVQGDLKNLKGAVKGELIEAESWTEDAYADPTYSQMKINYPGLQHPLLYVTGHLLWDPDLDLTKLMDEYYHLFYGPAEKEMRAFWETAEKSWMQRGDASTAPQTFKPEALSQMLADLDAAKANTTEGSAYRQRIELIQKEFEPAAKKSAQLAKIKDTNITIPYLGDTAPTIDGQLEPLWGGVPLVKLIDRTYVPGTPITHVRMGWTNDALYLSVVCYEPNMDKLVATALGRDPSEKTPIWNDDCVEVFLVPNAAPGAKAYHFIVNSLGSLWAASYGNNSPLFDMTWNSNAKVAVKKETGRWVVEMEIPWKDIGVSNPQQGLKIVGNVLRNRVSGEEPRQFSVAPLVASAFYQQENMCDLILGAPTSPQK